MRKFIGKYLFGLFIASSLLVVGCKQPSTPEKNSNNDSDKEQKTEKELVFEERYEIVKKLLSGKTFKQIDNRDVKTSEEYNFVPDGDVYVFSDSDVTIKTSKGNIIVDLSPFNIINSQINYKENENNLPGKYYNFYTLSPKVYFEIEDKAVFEVYIGGYDNRNMDGKGALIWDGTDDSGNTGGSGTGGSTDLSSFIQGDWNYSAFIANQNRACTLSLSGGNITASWVNTTVTGTYSVNSSVLHVAFKRTQGGNSADYEGNFEIELVNDTSFKLKAGNYLESFAMLFGVTGSEITFTK